MINADRAGGKVQFLDAQLLNDVSLQGISRLGAEALHAFGAIVAAQGREVHAGDSAEQPSGLKLLLHRAARVDGASAPLHSAGIDANLLDPFEVEWYPAVRFQGSTVKFDRNGRMN